MLLGWNMIVIMLMLLMLPTPHTSQSFFSFPAGSSQISRASGREPSGPQEDVEASGRTSSRGQEAASRGQQQQDADLFRGAGRGQTSAAGTSGGRGQPQQQAAAGVAETVGGRGQPRRVAEGRHRVQTLQALRDLMAEFASRTPPEDTGIEEVAANDQSIQIIEDDQASLLERGVGASGRLAAAAPVEEGSARGAGAAAVRPSPARERAQVYAPELDPINIQKRPQLRPAETRGTGQPTSLQEFTPSCPDSSLSYIIPSPVQCDLYFLCELGRASRRLCEDGLVFSLDQVKCVPPELESCEERPLLQPPQGTGPCTRRNGIFYTNSSCIEFVTCRDNRPAFERCADGLVFDPKQKICAWADEALRPGCLPEDLLGFRCPNPKLSIEDAISQRVHLRFGDHDRFADPTDCRYFFMCLRTGQPRRAGCGQGQVFDRSVGICRPAKDVAECADYYGTPPALPTASGGGAVTRGAGQAGTSRLARIEDDINRQFEEARRRLQDPRTLAKRALAEPEPEPE